MERGGGPEPPADTKSAGPPHSTLGAAGPALPHCSIRKAEKDHGVGGMIEGEDVKGKQVLLIEDIVSTAGSLLRGAQCIRAAGGHVVGAVFFMSYNLDDAYGALNRNAIPYGILFDIVELLRAMERKGKIDQTGLLNVLEWQVDPASWYEDWKRSRAAF